MAKSEDRVIFSNSFVKEQDWGNLTGKLITKITDTGIGIDESHLSKRRFKTFAFSKAGTNQIKSENHGVGIGLSTADSLSRALGGEVTLI